MNFKKLALSALVIGAVQAQAESWTDKVTVGGDFLFREQYLQYDGAPANTSTTTYNPQKTYWLNAVRARLDISAKINDMTKVYTRIGTNTSGRTSAITLGDSSGNGTPNKMAIGLDQAYAQIQPSESLKIWLGKSALPYFRTLDNEMIFDNDLTFEGAAVKLNGEMGSMKYFVNLGSNWISKASSSYPASGTGTIGNGAPADALMTGVQAGINVQDFVFVLSNYNFAALKGKGTVYGFAGGNQTTSSNYANDYNLVEASLDYTLDIGMPLTLSYDYVMNASGVDSTVNTGSNVGAKLGKLKDVGSWYAMVQYRSVKPEAVVAAFADSDFGGAAAVTNGSPAGGGSNIRGFKYSAGYQLMENTALTANYWSAQYNVDALSGNSGVGQWYNRVDLDLLFKF